MGSFFPSTTVALLLLVQGSGSLFLALLLGTLFAYRRRPAYLYWSLAWLCNSLWVIAGTLTQQKNDLGRPLFPLGNQVWLDYLASLCGWLQAAFWFLSLSRFPRPTRNEPAATGPTTSRTMMLLFVVAVVALLFGKLLESRERTVVVNLALAVVFAWAAVVAARHRRQVRRIPSLLLALVLGLHALDSLHLAGFHLFAYIPSDLRQPYAGFTVLVDWAVESMLAVAVILFLIDSEQLELQDTVARLEESQERFRLIFEHSGVGMSLLTREGRFLQVNPALTRMLGFKSDELKGKRLTDLLHVKETSKEGLLAASVPDGDTPSFYEREKRYVRKDGETIWARVMRVPIRDIGGLTDHYVGVLIDITQRKRAEEQLAASEKRYRLLNLTARDGIHITDETGRFVEANPAFNELLGYGSEALLRMSLTDLAVDPAAVRRHLVDVATRGGESIETQLRCRNGRLIDVEMSGALLDLDGKKLLHGICRDVSEKKRDKARLEEERDFSKQVLETADVFIFVVDPLGRLVHFNAACTGALGWREDEVRGRPFWDVLLPARNVATVREGHQRLLGHPAEGRQVDEPPHTYELHWRTRSNEEKLVAWRNAVVRDVQGQVRYVITTGNDVSRQRQLEEQVRQARKLESLATLVGGIAHDFNNQLTTVLGNLTMSLSDLETMQGDEHFLREPLLHAQEGARRCAEITRRLLTFSSGKVTSTSRLALAPLLRETFDQLRRDLPASIAVQLDVRGDPSPVVGDASQLQQVVLNLAANAADAMPRGGTLTLSLTDLELDEADCLDHVESRPGRFVELTVRDTGSGMSDEVQSHLFEPFFSTKTHGRSVGLGLAVAYGIVKAHQGWIGVHSEPGKGSTFRVVLPADVSIPVPTTESMASTATGTECVLIVDDEDLVRGLADAVMRRGGYDTLLAGDGEEAMAVYRTNRERIDLVLLDFSMPKMTGLEVMREMLRIDPHVCVIFTSGFTRDSDSDKLLATGAKAFIPKPYHPDELLNLVRRVLEEERVPQR